VTAAGVNPTGIIALVGEVAKEGYILNGRPGGRMATPSKIGNHLEACIELPMFSKIRSRKTKLLGSDYLQTKLES
jgi:hypothetical protein